MQPKSKESHEQYEWKESGLMCELTINPGFRNNYYGICTYLCESFRNQTFNKSHIQLNLFIVIFHILKLSFILFLFLVKLSWDLVFQQVKIVHLEIDSWRGFTILMCGDVLLKRRCPMVWLYQFSWTPTEIHLCQPTQSKFYFHSIIFICICIWKVIALKDTKIVCLHILTSKQLHYRILISLIRLRIFRKRELGRSYPKKCSRDKYFLSTIVIECKVTFWFLGKDWI